jgi:hypothetical protein
MLPHRRDKGHKWTLVTSISLYHRIDAGDKRKASMIE